MLPIIKWVNTQKCLSSSNAYAESFWIRVTFTVADKIKEALEQQGVYVTGKTVEDAS